MESSPVFIGHCTVPNLAAQKDHLDEGIMGYSPYSEPIAYDPESGRMLCDCDEYSVHGECVDTR